MARDVCCGGMFALAKDNGQIKVFKAYTKIQNISLVTSDRANSMPRDQESSHIP